MNLRFLESLIAVVETGSIAAAARVQGLTATAVSQRIRTLETDLDVQLLSRSAHSARPTEACMNLIPRARMLVREGAALKSDLDTSGLSGEFRLGAISTSLTDFVPGIVRSFGRDAPNAEFMIIPGPSTMLYDLLQSQELDAAITIAPPFTPNKLIMMTPLVRQRLVILSCQSSIQSVEDILMKHPLIVYEKSSWGGQIGWTWLKKSKLKYSVRCELDSLETIAVLVEEGLGVAIVPEWRGLRDRHPSLTITPIPSSGPEREIVFLSHRMANARRLADLALSTIETELYQKP